MTPAASPAAIREALERISKCGIDSTFLYVTETAFKKSIIDATSPVREYLKESGVHDYDLQCQGESERVYVKAHLLTASDSIATKASLYKPETKKGDPRIWFYRLKEYIEPAQAICIVAHNGELYVLNPLDDALWESANVAHSPLSELVGKVGHQTSEVAMELLALIRKCAAAPLKTVTVGDAGVGDTLEHALGIRRNSNRKPDYKGIELKAGRKNKKATTRSVLFAQVPNWDISVVKSAHDLAQTYGYWRNNEQQLRCELSATKVNSQGLYLYVDSSVDLLRERHTAIERGPDPHSINSFAEVVAWEIKTLKEALAAKHNETFWVAATSSGRGPDEVFTYNRVLHTRKPFIGRFDTLLDTGFITVDHLIQPKEKADGSLGRGGDKGPLFKIHQKNFGLLFPPPERYEIRE